MTTHPTRLNFDHPVEVIRQNAKPIQIHQTVTRGIQTDVLVRLELTRQQALMLRAAIDDAIKRVE